MKVALFFVCLCSLLLRGNTAINAGKAHHESSYATYSLIQLLEKEQEVGSKHEFTVSTYASFDSEKEYLINDEVEEEDTNCLEAPNYKLLARTQTIDRYPSYPAILNYLCNSYKVPSGFSGQVSHKYILQGVLRI